MNKLSSAYHITHNLLPQHMEHTPPTKDRISWLAILLACVAIIISIFALIEGTQGKTLSEIVMQSGHSQQQATVRNALSSKSEDGLWYILGSWKRGDPCWIIFGDGTWDKGVFRGGRRNRRCMIESRFIPAPNLQDTIQKNNFSTYVSVTGNSGEIFFNEHSSEEYLKNYSELIREGYSEEEAEEFIFQKLTPKTLDLNMETTIIDTEEMSSAESILKLFEAAGVSFEVINPEEILKTLEQSNIPLDVYGAQTAIIDMLVEIETAATFGR